MKQTYLSIFVAFALAGCSAKILKVDRAEEVLRVDAYEKKVHVKEISAPPVDQVAAPKSPDVDKKPTEKVKAKKTAKVVSTKAHEPAIEDGEGFVGRRPIADPFRVGEKITLGMSYFAVEAGTMEIEVLPFVEVNGRKAYHFQVTVKSNSFFSHIYAVDDKAVTYLDYENMVPLSLQITLKESKQLAETRTFFDWSTKKASYWQKKVTAKGESSKELTWDLSDYAQNVVSAAYYIRTFAWKEGKKYAVNVADEGKNSVYRGEVIRKEKLVTDAGTFNTVVVKPQVQVDGVFQPVGEILLWMTDDDRKFLVRIESKIKIGTIVAKLKAIDKGLGQ